MAPTGGLSVRTDRSGRRERGGGASEVGTLDWSDSELTDEKLEQRVGVDLPELLERLRPDEGSAECAVNLAGNDLRGRRPLGALLRRFREAEVRVTCLRLHRNHLRDEALDALIEHIGASASQPLAEIHLSDNHLTEAGIHSLIEAAFRVATGHRGRALWLRAENQKPPIANPKSVLDSLAAEGMSVCLLPSKEFQVPGGRPEVPVHLHHAFVPKTDQRWNAGLWLQGKGQSTAPDGYSASSSGVGSHAKLGGRADWRGQQERPLKDRQEKGSKISARWNGPPQSGGPPPPPPPQQQTPVGGRGGFDRPRARIGEPRRPQLDPRSVPDSRDNRKWGGAPRDRAGTMAGEWGPRMVDEREEWEEVSVPGTWDERDAWEDWSEAPIQPEQLVSVPLEDQIQSQNSQVGWDEHRGLTQSDQWLAGHGQPVETYAAGYQQIMGGWQQPLPMTQPPLDHQSMGHQQAMGHAVGMGGMDQSHHQAMGMDQSHHQTMGMDLSHHQAVSHHQPMPQPPITHQHPITHQYPINHQPIDHQPLVNHHQPLDQQKAAVPQPLNHQPHVVDPHIAAPQPPAPVPHAPHQASDKNHASASSSSGSTWLTRAAESVRSKISECKRLGLLRQSLNPAETSDTEWMRIAHLGAHQLTQQCAQRASLVVGSFTEEDSMQELICSCAGEVGLASAFRQLRLSRLFTSAHIHNEQDDNQCASLVAAIFGELLDVPQQGESQLLWSARKVAEWALFDAVFLLGTARLVGAGVAQSQAPFAPTFLQTGCY